MHGTLGDIWIFNTGDRTWITPVAEGKPPCPREMHTGTMLTDGRLLVFGGRSPAGQVPPLSEVPSGRSEAAKGGRMLHPKLGSSSGHICMAGIFEERSCKLG